MDSNEISFIAIDWLTAREDMSAAKIAPSLLSADFARLADSAKEILKDGADWLHLDVMVNAFSAIAIASLTTF